MSEALAARFKRLEPLIDRALDLEGEARDRFVSLCGEIHPDLIDDLRKALQDDAQALPALGGLAADVTRERPTDRRGLRAGPWRLLEKLGRGGMGTVYLAERSDGAFDKRVAIKLLRESDLRFKQHLERERRVLARLEHPAIARLLDGGETLDGQPYLVMELAEGRDLDKWLRERRPDLDTRLQVFLQVCGAVSDAHAHLIVHRDLKPSNIRVADDGSVKLLDFGIAKLLTSDGSSRGDTRALALTPEFAAPEQLRGQPVTTRTDVYALGALLYQMLTGRTPHPDFNGDWASYITRVCEEDAPAASAHVTQELPRARLRGDLDAIVRMALQRDPVRRYASVDALAADLRRYLDGRPVHAHPPSLIYSVRKWLRRWRWLVLSGFVFVSVLLAGVMGVLWQARDTAAERDAARLEARRYLAVLDYLGSRFRAVGESGAADSATAQTLLRDSVDSIERSFAEDPSTARLVLATLGEMHIYLDDFVSAEVLLRRFVELDDGSSAPELRGQVSSDLALAELRQGRVDAGCERIEQAITLLQASPSRQGSRVADALSVRAQCLRHKGDMAASLRTYREVVSLQQASTGAHSRQSAAAISNLATAQMQSGARDEARRGFEEALAIYREQDLLHLAAAATTLSNLAALSLVEGQLDAAQRYFDQALDALQRSQGESAALAAALNNAAKLNWLRGDLDAADGLLARALPIQQARLGAESPDVAFSLLTRADLAIARGDLRGALQDVEVADQILRARFGEQHFLRARAQFTRAHGLSLAGRVAEATPQFESALTLTRQVPGSTAADLRSQGACLALQHALRHRLHPAEAWIEDCKQRLSLRPATHFEAVESRILLGLVSNEPSAVVEAELAQLRALLGAQSPRVLALQALRTR
ncbi:MAG: protein kinase [Lysobacteraceae bacterium]